MEEEVSWPFTCFRSAVKLGIKDRILKMFYQRQLYIYFTCPLQVPLPSDLIGFDCHWFKFEWSLMLSGSLMALYHSNKIVLVELINK